MTPTDLSPFAVLFAQVCAVYQQAPSEALTELYWQVLTPYSLVAVRQAFTAHLGDPAIGHYFPKPADVIRRITGSAQARSQAAWLKIEEAIRRYGLYHSVAFDDPLIHRVISTLGGWPRLCQSDPSTLRGKAEQFHQHYQRQLKDPPEVYPAYLAGLMDDCLPKWVGNRDKAQAVFEAGKKTADAGRPALRRAEES